MAIVSKAGDPFEKQNPAYGLLRHTLVGAWSNGLWFWKNTLFDWLRGTTSMFVIGNFLAAIAKIVDIALTLYMWIIIARAVVSWVNPDPHNPIIRFLNAVTEPVLYQIRRRLPISFGGIDFSPIIVLLIIVFVQSFLVRSLAEMAIRMGG